MMRKVKEYHNEFAAYPAGAQLETNFWAGDVSTDSQSNNGACSTQPTRYEHNRKVGLSVPPSPCSRLSEGVVI